MRYEVDLVAYDDRGNEMLISLTTDGSTMQEAVANAILDARTLLRDSVKVIANGCKLLDE